MSAFLRFLSVLPIAVALAACSSLPTPQEKGVMPLVHDGRAEKGIKRAVVVIPGALASVGIYEPMLDWDVPDGAILGYRFPGIDGLKLDHKMDISEAGRLIADAMKGLEVDEVYLVGLSTGGPVALEAARRLGSKEVAVALISSAGPFPAGIRASVDGFFDVVKALVRSHGNSMEEAWLENYRTLLFGRNHFAEKDKARRSKSLAEVQRGHLQTPTPALTMAHTADLMTWGLPRDPGLSQARVALFHGAEDTVFPIAQTRRFARRIPADAIYVYPGQGHLLFVTADSLWSDIYDFFGLAEAD